MKKLALLLLPLGLALSAVADDNDEHAKVAKLCADDINKWGLQKENDGKHDYQLICHLEEHMAKLSSDCKKEVKEWHDHHAGKKCK